MSNELDVRSTLQVTNGYTEYGPTNPAGFAADMAGTRGPSPGALPVSTYGRIISNGTSYIVPGVSISPFITNTIISLTWGGLCRLQNLDLTNYVEYGIYLYSAQDDSLLTRTISQFYPLGEILPGESYVFRLARYLEMELPGTGTGTHGTPQPGAFFMLKATGASCQVLMEAFDA